MRHVNSFRQQLSPASWWVNSESGLSRSHLSITIAEDPRVKSAVGTRISHRLEHFINGFIPDVLVSVRDKNTLVRVKKDAHREGGKFLRYASELYPNCDVYPLLLLHSSHVTLASR